MGIDGSVRIFDGECPASDCSSRRKCHVFSSRTKFTSLLLPGSPSEKVSELRLMHWIIYFSMAGSLICGSKRP